VKLSPMQLFKVCVFAIVVVCWGGGGIICPWPTPFLGVCGIYDVAVS